MVPDRLGVTSPFLHWGAGMTTEQYDAMMVVLNQINDTLLVLDISGYLYLLVGVVAALVFVLGIHTVNS